MLGNLEFTLSRGVQNFAGAVRVPKTRNLLVWEACSRQTLPQRHAHAHQMIYQNTCDLTSRLVNEASRRAGSEGHFSATFPWRYGSLRRGPRPGLNCLLVSIKMQSALRLRLARCPAGASLGNGRVPASHRLCACSAAAPATSPPKTQTPEKSQVVTFDDVEFVVEEDPDLKSTWAQRATVAGSAMASALLLAQGLSHSDNPVVVGIAMMTGFIFAGLQLPITCCAAV